ncbi:MAG: BatA domain-containing protein [Gemmatimonadota bacterium]|nr:BatA domain-containing protein [Gemmatimonadota bacterium]
MRFLHPWALAAAVLAAVPILLHLARRDTRRRVPFPAIRYLRTAERSSARSRRLRDRLLATVRALLVVALAALAAGPLAGAGGPGSHEPTDVLLAVDNTAGMRRLAGDRILLDRALEAARQGLAHAGPPDRFWVVTPVDGLLAGGVPAAEAHAALAAVRPTDAGGSLPRALRDAAPLVPRVPGRAFEVQVVTDAQAGSWDGTAELPAGTPVRLLRLRPDDPGNRAVASVAVSPGEIVPPGLPLVVTARLAAWPADAGAEPFPARLALDGQVVAVASGPADGPIAFTVPELSPGVHELRVEIDPAGLRADDARSAGVRTGAPPRVVPADGADASFVNEALRALAAAGRLRLVDPSGPADLRVRAGGARVAAAGRAGAVPPARALLPPSDPVALPAFNRDLADAGVPWRLELDAAAGGRRLAAGGPPGTAGIRVARRYGLRRLAAPPSPRDSVLLRTEDGAPWAVRGETADGAPFVLFASALVPAHTELPLGVGLVPLLAALATTWTAGDAAPDAREAGAPGFLPARADSLAAPGGPWRPVEGGAPWRPLQAGAWRIHLRGPDGPATRVVGVHVPAAESDPAEADPRRLATALGGGELEIVDGDAPDAWAASLFVRRRGADLRPALLALVVLLLAAEAFLAAPRRAAARTEAAA